MKLEAAGSITRFLGVSLLLSLCTFPLALKTGATPVFQQPDQAAAALQQGRRLLKRGKSDQALGQLQTALNLYTAAKNNRGIAAAHNELGDLYLRQGQYNVALDHYKKAFEGFLDRKSTRLNSSHSQISYAVFCLKKKK